MTKRRWVKAGLITAAAVGVGLLTLLVLIESGALVRWMASPSDWQPQPMPALEMECGVEAEPTPWRYCVHRTPGSSSRDLIVHFHGRRGTERWWNDETYYTGKLYEHWASSEVAPPTVVSISFGPLWVLVGETGDALDPVLSRATEHAVAWAGHGFERVMLVGESMGGYNALIAALDAPQRFDKVAALCPPLCASSPFGRGLWRCSGQSGLREGFMLLAFSRAFFEGDAHWRAHDPVARVLDGESFEPTLHLSCGTRDPWGCERGARALVDAIETQGRAPDLRLLDEGHCAIDEERLAAFLAR